MSADKFKIGILRSGAGDWEGLYINGRLVAEGHSIKVEDVLRQVAKAFELEYEIKRDEQEEYLDRFGNSCPDSWDEI